MIRDINTCVPGSTFDTDVCIVGGGPAGIALALALSETRLAITLLESGGLGLEKATQTLAGGTTTGVPYFDLAVSRYRLLGGSTYRWGARQAPLTPLDFRRRTAVPHSGWPIDIEDLAPYYPRAFALAGADPSFPFDERVWRLFSNASPPRLAPDRFTTAAFQFGKTLLFGKTYRKALSAAANIDVLLHSTAVEIVSDPAEARVENVAVRTLAGGQYTVRAKIVVLACGGIENARLLLASDRFNANGLANRNGLVGRFFMEHPTVTAGRVSTDNPEAIQDLFSPGRVDGRLIEVGWAVSPTIQQAEAILNVYCRVVASVTADATQALREILWHARHHGLLLEANWYRKNQWLAARLGAILRDPLSIVANTTRHAMGKPKRFRTNSLDLQLRTEQEPNPESRVSLADKTDALGMRCSHLHWSLTERDKRTMRVAAETFDAELSRLNLGRLEVAEWLREPDLTWPPDLVGGYHHMGTTRMASDAATGVVDANCRVHGIDNLYVAGSSVFPTAGYVNPTATILALTLRLADHIKSRMSA